MNKEVENKHALSEAEGLVPELRFPEFLGKKTWADRRLSDVLFEHGTKSEGDEEVFSVSVHKGVINQIEHLGRRFAAATTDHYSRVLPGDVIYTKSPTGDFPFGVIKQSKVSKPVIVSPLYGVFKPETYAMGVILDAYFEYPERTINYLASIIQKGAKNTINIKNDTFLSKSLILPTDPDEQQKIASCLSSLDELITAESDRLETLKAHKKGLMQQLFPAEGETVPKLRFKEFEGSGEWVELPLNGVCEVNPSTEELPDKFIYIDLEAVKAGVLQQKKIITRSEAPSRAQRLLNLGDIIFQTVRPYQKNNYHYLIQDSELEAVASTGYAQLRAFQSATYLFQYLLSDIFVQRVLIKSTGTNYPAINSSDLSQMVVAIPSIDEQQKIATCLSSLDELISAQAAKIDGLKEHKKGLMQGLFPRMN